MIYPWDDPNDPYVNRSDPYPPGSTAPDPYLNHPPESDPHVIPVLDPTAPPTTTTRPKLPPDQRPPAPSPTAVWNDDWWDGKSPYTGGWLEPNTDPRTDRPSAPTGGILGAAPDQGNFDWPSYSAPDYYSPSWIDTPAFQPGPSFSYADFTAPNPADVGKDPAFQFRFDQGVKALGANRAGRGTFLSGETGKALQDYGQQAASQEYDNVFNRALTGYNTNRENSFGQWAAQYGQRKDAYDYLSQNNQAHNQFNLSDAGSRNTFNLSNAQTDFSGKNTQALAKFNDLFNRYKAQGDWLSNLYSAGAD